MSVSIPNAESAQVVVPVWRSHESWIKIADILAILVAVSLPWSTSLVAIFVVMWFLSLIPIFDIVAFRETLKRPASLMPVLLVILAVIGTLWATDIPWPARLQGISPVVKLLAIPLLIYHFERSERGIWVMIAFLASCTVLMLLSSLIYIDPRFIFDSSKIPGVPVKNSIAQSQEFALCAIGTASVAMYLLAQRRVFLAIGLIILSLTFMANMVFIVSSRTVIVCIPVLVILFAIKFFGKKGVLLFLICATLLASLAWEMSPGLRHRLSLVSEEYKLYSEQNAVTSTGQRLEYWRKSIKFIERAPLLGHGTGATKTLFERDAVGQTGVSADIIGNPHNQTLNVAVQWGLPGFIILYAMWLAHLILFHGTGMAGWIGLVAVVENIVSSLFNSHISDFHEGWIYVLAVGVSGGLVFKQHLSGDERSDTVRSPLAGSGNGQ